MLAVIFIPIFKEDDTMKLPNGYGSITKLTGNRRKPWMARVTCDETYDEMKHD